MHDLRQRLAAWTDDAIISPQQADHILAFEREHAHHAPEALDPADPLDPAAPRRSAVAEAVGYLGALLALSAVALIVGDLWPELTIGARLTLVGLLTVVGGGAGQAIHGQPTAAMGRLSGVLWAAAAVGSAWFAGILIADVLGAGTAASLTGAGAAGAAVALPLQWRRPALPLQLVALASVVAIATGLLEFAPLRPDTFYGGLLVATIGSVWFLLGRGGWMRPRRRAETLGGGLAVLGMQVGSFGDLRVLALGLGVLLAAAMVALAVQEDAAHLLIVGASGAFVLLPQVVVELFGDAIGAPATLLAVGLLLVLLAVGLGRARREVGTVTRTGTTDAGGHR